MYHLSLQVVLLRMIYSTSRAIANAFALFWGPLILLWMAYWAGRSQLQTTCLLWAGMVYKGCLINVLLSFTKRFLAKHSEAQLMFQFHRAILGARAFRKVTPKSGFPLLSGRGVLRCDSIEGTLIPHRKCQSKIDIYLLGSDNITEVSWLRMWKKGTPLAEL